MIGRYSRYLFIGLIVLLIGCSEQLGSDHDVGNPFGDGTMTTLRIALFDRNNKPNGAPAITNNFMTQYIQEQFGDPNRIKIEFVTIPRSEEVEKLNILIKANQGPDIVFISPVNEELNVITNSYNPQYSQFTIKSIEYGMNDGIELPRIQTVIESEIKYMDILTEKYDDVFVKVITAHPEMFDAVYDKEVEDYMSLGGEQVMTEKRNAYRAEH